MGMVSFELGKQSIEPRFIYFRDQKNDCTVRVAYADEELRGTNAPNREIMISPWTRFRISIFFLCKNVLQAKKQQQHNNGSYKGIGYSRFCIRCMVDLIESLGEY